MKDSESFAARFEDLLLRIAQDGVCWRATVEEADDPSSALSDGTGYGTINGAKQGAVSIALELFGTRVSPHRLEWRPE